MTTPGRYLPISSYGIIGDLHTAALVGLNGSIDWFCAPSFDSGSVFASILDVENGGRFQIAPKEPYTSVARYEGTSAVLVTTFTTESGQVEITDFMPAVSPTNDGTIDPRRRVFAEIHRRVRCLRGAVELGIELTPRFNYAELPTEMHGRVHGLLATDADDEVLTLALASDLWWTFSEGRAVATLKVECNSDHRPLWFVLRYDDDEVRSVASYDSDRKLRETIAFWSAWVGKIRYDGPYRVPVERSAVTLKLLCYAPTGAIIAAPTTSLPEEIGGVRNWDYRFSWIRDSVFVLYSLSILGHSEEADQFMAFLKRVARKTTDTHLQVMYGIDGRRDLRERVLPHFEGYRGSAPVRIGNGAYDQLQLDVYGELLETAYLWSRSNQVTEGTWVILRRLIDWVATHWRRPDSGIWEVRAGLQHYVLSKVMCWVALDRGVRMAEEFGLTADTDTWARERDAVHADVMSKGWSERKQSFVQYYGTEALDASNLVIPMVGFLPATHPRVKGTIAATERELTNGTREMVYRYLNDDGIEGGEGVFSICTFWLAEALALSGETERARQIFDRMMTCANHLGLYSEEIAPESGAFLGNFPQAFTHIALINCAHTMNVLSRATQTVSEDVADTAPVTASPLSSLSPSP